MRFTPQSVKMMQELSALSQLDLLRAFNDLKLRTPYDWCENHLLWNLIALCNMNSNIIFEKKNITWREQRPRGLGIDRKQLASLCSRVYASTSRLYLLVHSDVQYHCHHHVRNKLSHGSRNHKMTSNVGLVPKLLRTCLHHPLMRQSVH